MDLIVPETIAARRSRMITLPSEAMSVTGSIGTTLLADCAITREPSTTAYS